jgi:8-oxo-dGTP pyrophosphatase MutT (NUDIX family)
MWADGAEMADGVSNWRASDDAERSASMQAPIFIPRPAFSSRSFRNLRWTEVNELGSVVRDGALQPHLTRARRRVGGSIQASSGFVREKIAAGLILVRTPEQTEKAKDVSGGRREYQALMVKGRHTYAFSEFVHGRYERSRLDTVRQLISEMTIEERLVIASLDFDEIWNKVWARRHIRVFNWRPGGSTPYSRLKVAQNGWPPLDQSRDSLYRRRNAKFEESWLNSEDSKKTLSRLLNEAKGIGKVRWEFPKGKRHARSESDLSCAIREFQEETRVNVRNFHLLPGFARVEMYSHMRVLYVNTYFLAALKHQVADPATLISLSNYDQISEVSDVRWMGIEAMRVNTGPVGRDLTVMGRLAFQYVKDYFRSRTAPSRILRSLDVRDFVLRRPGERGKKGGGRKRFGSDSASRALPLTPRRPAVHYWTSSGSAPAPPPPRPSKAKQPSPFETFAGMVLERADSCAAAAEPPVARAAPHATAPAHPPVAAAELSQPPVSPAAASPESATVATPDEFETESVDDSQKSFGDGWQVVSRRRGRKKGGR